MIRFAAHVVPGNSGLLPSRLDLKALGANIHLQKDQLNLSNPDATPNLATTPSGHNGIDLLDCSRELPRSQGERDVQSSTVRVSELIEANLVIRAKLAKS